MSYPVEDHLQILNVLARYSFALDSHDQPRLVACFHPEAQISFCGTILTPAEFAAGTATMLDGVLGMHQAGNHMIDIDGDSAIAASYVFAVHVLPENNVQAEVIFGHIQKPTDSVILGRYDDKFEKRDGEWKMLERKITFLWQQHLPTMPIVPGWSAM